MVCENFKLTGIVLQEHQKKVIKFILHPKNRSVLLFHSLGSGKTISSLIMARCLTAKYPDKNVTIITPASLISNFEREAARIDLTFKPTIESYGKFVNILKKKKWSCTDNILIMDEVQNLNGEQSVMFKHIYNCAKHAYKVILLSATPVKNSPDEIANQMSLLLNEKVSRGNIDTIFNFSPVKRNETFEKLLKCKVSYYKKNLNNINYPTVKEHIIKLVMPIKFYKEYYKVQEDIKENLPEIFDSVKNLTIFLNGIRRNVNVSHEVSEKIIWIINKITKDLDKNKKIMVYSNWLGAGIDILKQKLKELNISYSEITGRLTKAEKDINIKKYNSDENNVLLISSSGGEGISLKKTRTVIILEPHWNSAKIEQVIGRAARFKSHNSLPIVDRQVDVYHLLLTKPKGVYIKDFSKSADIILHELSNKKKKMIDTFYNIVEQKSIENDSKCKIKN